MYARQAVKAALLYNFTTGKILYQYNPNLPLAPASLTKIMTMFLVMDAIKAKKLSYGQKVPVSREAATIGGSSLKIAVGERVPVVRLLTGAAVASGNDAARALAEATGKGEAAFVKKMNAKAAALGMKKTRFKNSTGLPAAGQKTTVYDLLLLCRAYLRTHPEALRFHRTLYIMHKGTVIRNTNPLLGVMDGADGLKTGWTADAGYNLIATAKRGNTRLIAIVMGGKTKADRAATAKKLLEAGFKYPTSPAKAKAAINGEAVGTAGRK
ncbi:MAG: D-alanyl-D-alanine carboxypeptidase [Desulfovibrio sp.]|nr:D-alanyl-D-alanine carboxypeptidase [Desulfovibrio sp.]